MGRSFPSIARVVWSGSNIAGATGWRSRCSAAGTAMSPTTVEPSAVLSTSEICVTMLRRKLLLSANGSSFGNNTTPSLKRCSNVVVLPANPAFAPYKFTRTTQKDAPLRKLSKLMRTGSLKIRYLAHGADELFGLIRRIKRRSHPRRGHLQPRSRGRGPHPPPPQGERRDGDPHCPPPRGLGPRRPHLRARRHRPPDRGNPAPSAGQLTASSRRRFAHHQEQRQHADPDRRDHRSRSQRPAGLLDQKLGDERG
jgi:hypothetical protein